MSDFDENLIAAYEHALECNTKGDAEDVFRIASVGMFENKLGDRGRVLVASLLLRVANCDDGDKNPGGIARKVLSLRGRPVAEDRLLNDLYIYAEFEAAQAQGQSWDQARAQLASAHSLTESGVEKARTRAQKFLHDTGNK